MLKIRRSEHSLHHPPPLPTQRPITFHFCLTSTDPHPLPPPPSKWKSYVYHLQREFCEILEAVAQKCSVKTIFFKIRKTHKKMPVPESLF